MVALGYPTEAYFCQLVRDWYRAEDQPGISANKRLKMRLALREFLLAHVNFKHFPPPGTHICGMSRPMMEGFLQSIDTHIQMHAIVKGGAYNPRAIQSLANETFFVEMAEHEQTRLGCPKATHCAHLLSSVTEIMHYRHNPQNR